MNMIRFLVFFGIACGLSNGAFFDLTDIDDPLSLLWNTKDTVVQNLQDQRCTSRLSDGTKLSGFCTQPSYCLLSGGKPYGLCGILSTCCTYQRSCGKTTKSKVSYFTSGTELGTTSLCSYDVQLENNNICQIRLDFELFRLAPPRVDGTGAYKCLDDALDITPNTYNIPQICGYNDQQHVYVHVNPTTSKTVSLKMTVSNRVDNNNLPVPLWRIKVTQLECPGNRNILDHNKNAGQDYSLLAPKGAIQFYTKTSDRIRSFAFDSSSIAFNYPNGISYAMAFNKLNSNCRLRFTINYMNLGATTSPPTSDADCSDYLFVPELAFDDTTLQTTVAKVCLNTASGTTTQSITFTSNPPGPFYINFKSGATAVDTTSTQPYAFDIKYDILNC